MVTPKSKKKFFNTAGLCLPDRHYMLDPLKRLTRVEKLIQQELYFTIHAPRQSGKTTYLYALAQQINREGERTALVVSFEQAGYESISVDRANRLLVDCVFQAGLEQLPEPYRPPTPEKAESLTLINYLKTWCRLQTRPVVLLIDEIDALLDDVFVAVLRQLRDGYQSRPGHFPSSVILVGLRDVRDYKAKIRSDERSWGTGSPFNIKSDSFLLKNFSRQWVDELLEQHTTETGQVFPLEVKEEIFRLTAGQPWLVNALARLMVSWFLGDDDTRPVTMEALELARKELILRRDTHLDGLVERLREPRVKRIVQAIINGDNLVFDILEDDIVYVRDLGIVSSVSPLQFSNPIYAEIIPRVMAFPIQESIPGEIQPARFLDKSGQLDMDLVLREFQVFYRRNAASWLDRYEYKESAHQLLMMAFLQRVINAGGDITREMAVGNGRLDLLVRFKEREFALELKIRRDSYTVEDGKEQLDRYLDTLGLDRGYLVIFDPTQKGWEEKLYFKNVSYNGKPITMVGL